MGKPTITKYTLVQHSGYGYAERSEFKAAVETRMITRAAEERRVLNAGGIVLDKPSDAYRREDEENYPPGTPGLTPRAKGSFSRKKIDGLPIYIPPFEEEE